MRVFVAGATGAVGQRLIPLLVGAGHSVVGMTRSETKTGALRAAGADRAIADGLDRDAVIAVVLNAQPEVVIHQLSALAALKDLRKFDKEFAQTNRLRTEGLDHLLAAARAAGARRFVAQSYTGWTNGYDGPRVKNEDDPLDPNPPPAFRRTLEAIRYLESTVPAAKGLQGLVLRYGNFYGPGTSVAEGGTIVEAVRRRRFPIVSSGAGVWSWIHIDDVARATLAAVARGEPGLYNVVDDEPAPVSEWLPALTAAIGAKAPRRVPAWLGRFFIGAHGVAWMTKGRGASNAKAKRELGWRVTYPSWRVGFTRGLAG